MPATARPLMQKVAPSLRELSPIWVRLQATARQGGIDRGLSPERAWSVADHTALVAALFLEYAESFSWTQDDRQWGLRMILLHDASEAPWRDSTPETDPWLWAWGSRPKHLVEKFFLWKALRQLPRVNAARHHVRDEWKRVARASGSKKELASVIKELDKLAGLIELIAYAQRSPQQAVLLLELDEKRRDAQWRSSRAFIRSPSLVRLRDELEKLRQDFASRLSNEPPPSGPPAGAGPSSPGAAALLRAA